MRRTFAAWLLLSGCAGSNALLPDVDAGSDSSPAGDLAPPSAIGPMGGSVPKLFFAVVGDTRPANIDDTANYPVDVITQIYADLAAMNPRPQFVVTTGDYMFASPYAAEGAKQMALYSKASAQFPNPIFSAMGNHECTGATASNCASAPTNNMAAFMDALVKPLGQSKPYYTVPVSDDSGKWTAKIVIAACNAWDPTQSSWLAGELAKPTTYTFVVRHEPTGTQGPPCVGEMDSMLSQATYDLFIVGHSHTFQHRGKQLTVGNGGAPLSGGVTFGYATVEQQDSGGFLVTQYEYAGATPIDTFTVQ